MFETIAKDFEGGGSLMFPIVLLGMALWSGLLATVVAHLVAKAPRLSAILAKVVGALALALVAFGVFATIHTMRLCVEAVAHVQPTDWEIILMAGADEALILVQYALGIAIVPGVVAWLVNALATAPKATAKAA